MDVKSALLYNKIEEEVYACQPLGFEDPQFPDRGQSQDKYVDEILKKFGFSTVKTVSTPMDTSNPLLKDAEAKDVVVHLYRSMIGSLMYLTASRPDIIFVVSRLIVANSTTEAEYVAASSCCGEMSSIGELTFFLGLQVTQKADGIFISQDKYVDKILKKLSFSTVKTVSTPMETLNPLLIDTEAKDVAPASTPIVSPYQLPQAKDKGKAKMVEPEKPLKKKDQIAIDEEVARNFEAQLQAELEEEERSSRPKELRSQHSIIESWDNTQAMMDADFQLVQQMRNIRTRTIE
ncbi:uncharacterized mitochondrial protein-like protein [Tanacetum coccineum]